MLAHPYLLAALQIHWHRSGVSLGVLGLCPGFIFKCCGRIGRSRWLPTSFSENVQS